MPRVKTPNQGAGDTRRQISIIVEGMIKRAANPPFINGTNLLKNIGKMPLRSGRKAGGLGTK